MKRYLFIICLIVNLLLSFLIPFNNSYTLSYKDTITSIIEIDINQTYIPVPNTKTLEIEIPSKLSFQSYYFSQDISEFKNTYSQEPSRITIKPDSLGNEILIVRWKNVNEPIEIKTSFEAKTSINIQAIESNIAYPYYNIPEKMQMYLTSTDLVQSDNKTIKNKAEELIKDIDTWHLAVMRILSWVNNNMEYIAEVPQPTSINAYNKKKGNCSSFSNLSAALLRSVGIPVRIIGGITFDELWTIYFQNTRITQKNGEERHSWIQVWYADIGWVDYDVASPFLGITSRYIIQNIGLDSYEAQKKWRFSKGYRPKESEEITRKFGFDEISQEPIVISYNSQYYFPNR